ncbi:hypothetical protein ACFWO3_21175, partial [Rhodococcus sp. NPDC058521]
RRLMPRRSSHRPTVDTDAWCPSPVSSSTVLHEHITCVKAIHDMVGAQVAETLTTDDQTAQALARANA